MLLKLAIAVLFAAGVGILVFSLMPGRFGSPFAGLLRRRNEPVRRLRLLLATAGLYDEAPLFTLLAVLTLSVLVGAFIALFVHSLAAVLLGFPLVMIPALAYVRRKQAHFLERAQVEIIPFLSRMEAATRANEPTPTAFRAALADPSCRLLRSLLADAAHKMGSNTPFIVALRETTERVPLPNWVDFVDQMELHSSTGGAVADAISESIKGINEQIALGAEGKAAYARAATQQKAILGLVTIGLLLFFFVLNPGSLGLMFGSVLGIVILVAGIGMITIGQWFGRRAMDDIKEWIG